MASPSPEATLRRRSPFAGARAWLRRAGDVVRRMIGVPDYDRYLAHMRQRYPGCTPMDRQTFERDRLTARYKSTGSRCC